MRDEQSPVVQRHLNDLGTLPGPILDRLRETGTELFIGDAKVPDLDELEDLAGKQPRGWPDGSRWDEVPGAYVPGEQVLAAGAGPHGSSSLVLHEGGHALDAHERLSRHPAMKEAHKEQFQSLRSYYRQGGKQGRVGREEMWAEGFAVYFQEGPQAAARTFGAGFVAFLENQFDLDSSSPGDPSPSSDPPSR